MIRRYVDVMYEDDRRRRYRLTNVEFHQKL